MSSAVQSHDHKTFALVADNPCGLSRDELDSLGVLLIPSRLNARAEEVAAFYRSLLEEGYTGILSVHVGSELALSYRTAVDARGNVVGEGISNRDTDCRVSGEKIVLLDTENAPAAQGIIMERLSTARAAGANLADVAAYGRELSEAAGTLFITMDGEKLIRHQKRPHRFSLQQRFEHVRRRLSSEMYLYLLAKGVFKEIGHSHDLSDLTARISRSLSAAYTVEGSLTYVITSSGDGRAEAALRKPLDTNEYEAAFLAVRPASKEFSLHVGATSVGVAFVPTKLYDKAETLAMEKIDILLLGSGGREYVILTKLRESPHAGKIYVAPGNGGMVTMAEAVDVDQNNPEAVAAFARQKGLGLVVIGPEAPLVEGVADAVRASGVACFGPSKEAAQMEGSKAFAKRIMERAGVPTAAWKSFTDKAACEEYVRSVGAPIVVKADGLAAGKGVIVAATLEQALEGVHECFSGQFGSAGTTVVIEEFLEGPECSLLALTDGKTLIPLATAQDHKRAFDGDAGPNTGGMGVFSPSPHVTDKEYADMVAIEKRVVAELASEGIPYSGCLYGGFMLTKDGPRVLEFNARFGDPETQVILPRLKGDLVEIMCACDAGTLDTQTVDWSDEVAVSVVLASAGYPGSIEKGKEITGIEAAERVSGVLVSHAGTSRTTDGRLVTAGGRVLNVTALADDFEQARTRAYEAVDQVHFDGKQYRSDIGLKALRPREA